MGGQLSGVGDNMGGFGGDVVEYIKRYWFLLGLTAIFLVTLTDAGEKSAGVGIWLKAHGGPDLVIFLIFFCSGMLLDASQVRAGVRDTAGTGLALLIIFAISPLLALLFNPVPLDPGVRIGLFLVAVMPTTLSSGVVMTAASGGNMAHALLITILANGISVFSIPHSLSLMLGVGGGEAADIDKVAIMIKLGGYVLVPLFMGWLGRVILLTPRGVVGRIGPMLSNFNQVLVLSIVWMAMAQAREVIRGNMGMLPGILLLSFVFHGLLAASAGAGTALLGIGKGRRESVIFMGGQKTLPLSVILQVSLFPEYGLALVVCVVHHVVHLIMDSYLVGKIRGQRPAVDRPVQRPEENERR